MEGDLPSGLINFLLVFFHEIDHILDLSHGNDRTAVMYPWYQQNITILSSDDKLALEFLYGKAQFRSKELLLLSIQLIY